jgi:hypothetical protein
MAPEVNTKLIAGNSTWCLNSESNLYKKSKPRAVYVVAGTNFTIAEEMLLLLGLQVGKLNLQSFKLKKMFKTPYHCCLQRFGPDFPAISEALMPNKSADLLRYRYKVAASATSNYRE